MAPSLSKLRSNLKSNEAKKKSHAIQKNAKTYGDDSKAPMNWPKSKKLTMVCLVILADLNDAMGSSIFAPVVHEVSRDFHASSSSVASLLISVHVIGYIAGPLILSPLSEVYGRCPLIHGSNTTFVAATIICTTSVNIPMIIIGRILMGFAGSVPATVGGGVISDIIPVDERGYAYGFLVFRRTKLTEDTQVQLAARFGELDDVTPWIKPGTVRRLNRTELMDMSNIKLDGTLASQDDMTTKLQKGNLLFHVDSSYNPRRASYSFLLGKEIPPSGHGGQTAFADTRTAFDELPMDLKHELLENEYVACHSIHHSRKLAAPEYFGHIDPSKFPMGRHRIVQQHEPSGRSNLYIASHIHHIEGLEFEKSKELVDRLMQHATQDKFVTQVEWKNIGDLIIWDNTCLMHRAVGGTYINKYKRDLRRAIVHDNSSWAWGLNDHREERQSLATLSQAS
ncbi:uncharacterized protein BHQ10_000670 [Talaromyces amestolkiae]|uniref:TauD/TfdA-like domain-containing protein n=1 Tax=Talaromyces amestolkiae TaxID=1196081 RepID=A0A364KM76_TALAM|nr:uncharacterized protein BHQ10_000670 [Talaromyces amestolkiae]RAO64658.1 hypothetical protein BHQ10_000670 [Talaromyces amestolkiae]